MNDPIMLTPLNIIHMMVAACAALATVSTAFAIIMKWISKVKNPEMEQNARLDSIEKRIDEIDRKLAMDKKRLDNIEYGHEVTQEAILALLNYSLNSEEVEGLKIAKKKLESYLISRGERIDEPI